jgi:hypothetical protein
MIRAMANYAVDMQAEGRGNIRGCVASTQSRIYRESIILGERAYFTPGRHDELLYRNREVFHNREVKVIVSRIVDRVIQGVKVST